MTQQEALNILKLGHNVFLTGPAGSGKTYVLNQFIRYLRKHKIGVGITASTGIAATHMNGMTIHAWAGIGIKDELSTDDLDHIAEKSQLVKRLNETKVLIIDEVSMLHGYRLDMIDMVCRRLKDANKPFGGLQVVLSGDLFQLPPITREGNPDFVYKSKAWQSMNLKICYLSEQHRQEDGSLLNLLNAIRDDAIEDYHQDVLRDRFRPSPKKRTITKLYTHNAAVDEINFKALNELDSAAKVFSMTSEKGPKRLVETMKLSCLAPEELVLKTGAEVMFVANNFAQNFVNGTRGMVVDFSDDGAPIVVTKDDRTLVVEPHSWKLMDGEKIRAEISQIPLRLAWAITIHKSQGMSLDDAEIDLSKAFEPGMGYVALSRVRNLDGLYLLGVNQMAMTINQEIREQDVALRRQSARAVAGLQNMDDNELLKQQERVATILAPERIDESYDEEFFDQLKTWRFAMAKKRSAPAYTILPDKTLKGLARLFPKTKKDLATITGIGPAKLEQYGNDLLEQIKQYSPAEKITTDAK